MNDTRTLLCNLEVSQADASEANQTLLHKSDHQPHNYYYSIPRRQRQGDFSFTWHVTQRQIKKIVTLVVCTSHSPAQAILSQLIPVWRAEGRRESTWESFQRAGWRPGKVVTEVPVAPWAVMSKADGCVVRGEVGLHSRWALHRQRFPLMQIAPDDNLKKKKKITQRERERENWRKTSDVWAVQSLNRIFSHFPMKHQEVLKLQSVHLTPRGSCLTFPLHFAALVHNTPRIATSEFIPRKPNLVHLFTHRTWYSTDYFVKGISTSSASRGFTANAHPGLETNQFAPVWQV